MDSDGLVSVIKNPGRWSTGNGLLYTGMFYTMLVLRGEARTDDLKRFEDAVINCYVPGYPGLLNRNPNRPDHEAQDDYIGVMAAGFHLKSKIAETILNHGMSHNYCWNNESPESYSLECDHDRFPGLIYFYQSCAEKLVSKYSNILLSLEIFFDAFFKNDISDHCLTWVKTTVLAETSLICAFSASLWNWRIEKKFGSLNMLFSKYFGEDHPFSRYN
jgi:hypothetical protein